MEMKNRVRSLSLMLCLCALLASCGGGQTAADTEAAVTTTDSEAVQTETAAFVPELLEADYGGATFTFLNGNTGYTYCNIVVEEETGDVVYDTLYRRNLGVEEAYNIRFAEVPSKSIVNDALKSVQAGDNSYDVALMQCENALKLMLDNAAVDFAEIPYLNMDQPWWMQSAQETMSIDHRNFFALSMFDISHFETARVLFFNRTMTERYDLTSPYTLVDNGTWTLDKFREYAVAAISDLNGDGVFDTADQYGFTAYPNVGAPALMIGIEAPLTLSKDDNDMPLFDMENEYYFGRLNLLCEMLFCQDGFLNLGWSKGDTRSFEEGRCMFYINTLTTANGMRDMTDEFGIIPTPKYDESQSEYCNYGGSPFYMVVPPTTEDLSRTGAVLEMLAYTSVDVVDTAYYDVLLQGKISRDADTRRMLDLIFTTQIYQTPIAQKYVQTDLVDLYIWKNNTDFASYFAKKRNQIQSDIDAAVEAYQANNQS
ncbi:MAG: hypothetical protein IJ302_05795 [Clostridia bacterium]|nr:hypothetical protein [Clostridia bacterium]